MKIAVASGKGGTGKTMVATSLAATLAPFYKTSLIDCDVEAPNAYLFLKPEFGSKIPAILQIPRIDPNVCNFCSTCVDVCQYHALAMIADQILVFPQLCHGCGSCSIACPVDAISEVEKEIGHIFQGRTATGISHDMGVLIASEPMPTPIIHQLKALERDTADITILDSPPGASCAVVATMYDADYILLVTEPTPFGLHDLKQMLGIIYKMDKPAGFIINRDGIGDDQVEKFIDQTPFKILMIIPYQSEIAAGLGSGQLLTDLFPIYQEAFITLFNQIAETIKPITGAIC